MRKSGEKKTNTNVASCRISILPVSVFFASLDQHLNLTTCCFSLPLFCPPFFILNVLSAGV